MKNVLSKYKVMLKVLSKTAKHFVEKFCMTDKCLLGEVYVVVFLFLRIMMKLYMVMFNGKEIIVCKE